MKHVSISRQDGFYFIAPRDLFHIHCFFWLHGPRRWPIYWRFIWRPGKRGLHPTIIARAEPQEPIVQPSRRQRRSRVRQRGAGFTTSPLWKRKQTRRGTRH